MERVFARLRTMLRIAGRTMRPVAILRDAASRLLRMRSVDLARNAPALWFSTAIPD
jgi:hypothetical protein